MRSIAGLGILFCFVEAAHAQRGETCGQVSPQGECQEEDAVYCTDPGGDAGAPLARISCNELSLDTSDTVVPGRCALLGDYGAWCVLPPGSPCAGFDDDDVLFTFACGDLDGTLLDDAACDLSSGCVRDVGTCEPGTTPLPQCVGSRAALGCTAWGQLITLDCEDPVIDGPCVDGACIVSEGSRCAPLGPIVCEDGTVCTGASEGRPGTCVRSDGGPLLDAGTEIDGNGGRSDVDEELLPPFSLSCDAMPTRHRSAIGTLALFALLGASLRRRRHRSRAPKAGGGC